MNLYQLKYFQAVCTYLTVSDAAKYLHISQPSLSNAIKELESEFGVTLFKRHHRGMIPTHEGEILLELSNDLLNRSEHLEKVMNNLGKKRNFLRLGVPPMIGSLILPKIYGEFIPANPDIELKINEGGRQNLIQKLSEDAIDMAFLPHIHPLDPPFVSQLVSKLEIVCCISKRHPLSDRKSISAKDLSETPVVLFENGFFHNEEVRRWFATADVHPKILLQTQQLSTLQSIITHNIAAGFMFRHLIEKDSDFVPLPLHNPIYANISLVWKKDTYFFDGMQKLNEFTKHTNILEIP